MKPVSSTEDVGEKGNASQGGVLSPRKGYSQNRVVPHQRNSDPQCIILVLVKVIAIKQRGISIVASVIVLQENSS